MDFSYVHIRFSIGYVCHICLQDTIQSTILLCLLCQATLLPMPLRPLLLTTRSSFSCTHAPLLCMDIRSETVVLCILHLLMAVGKYLSVRICKRSQLLKPARRTKFATLLRRARTGDVLVGKGAPDGEESWNLLAHWEEIAKLLRAGPNTKNAGADMYMLLQNLHSTRYNAKALKCKQIA